MKIVSKLLLFGAAFVMLGTSACKKDYLDRVPTDEVPMEDAFKTTEGARAALEGMHGRMFLESDHDKFGQKSIDIVNDLMGDDMGMLKRGAGWFISWANYSNSRGGNAYIWSFYYRQILNANQILENIDAAVGPQEEKDNIKGQAHFYLAFSYFNLVQYYQHPYMADRSLPGVPIYHTVSQEGQPRASVDEVYKEIEANLRAAENLLDPSRGYPNRPDKSEINQDVAFGLHARVAMVMNKWSLADSMAGAARRNFPYMSANDLMGGFNDWGVSSWMWGSYINEEQTGIYASFLSHFDYNLGGYAALGQQKTINNALINTMPRPDSLGQNYDIRRNWWITAPVPGSPLGRNSQLKFTAKTPGSFSSDVCYMRSEEMGLIQAEARAQMGNIPAARQALTEIMLIRYPEYDISGISQKDQMLREVWYQRRIELWGEGFRFFDLRRNATIQAAQDVDPDPSRFQRLYNTALHREYTGGESSIWGSTKTITDPLSNMFLFRISLSEINYNPIEQNP